MVFFSFVGGVFALSGLFIIYMSSTWSLKDRLIIDLPTSKVQSIAMGLVELYGVARPYEKNRMKTPFTHLDCIWCGWVVENEHIDKNGRVRTQVLGRGELPGLFILSDETGEVPVYTRGAKADAKYLKTTRGYMDDKLRDFIRKNTSYTGRLRTLFTDIGLFGATNVVLTEYFLAPFEKTYVLGTACNNPLVLDGTTEKNEEDIIISKGKDIFYISTKSIDKIHMQASGGIKPYLVIGSIFVSLGVLLILI